MTLRHSYDATNSKWISDAVSPVASGTARPAVSNPAGRATNTGMTPASGAAADLRHTLTSRDTDTVLRFPFSASRPPSVPSHNKTAGTLADDLLDGLKVVLGMLALACVAMFFLILA